MTGKSRQIVHVKFLAANKTEHTDFKVRITHWASIIIQPDTGEKDWQLDTHTHSQTLKHTHMPAHISTDSETCTIKPTMLFHLKG